jgi:hypothetical protein
MPFPDFVVQSDACLGDSLGPKGRCSVIIWELIAVGAFVSLTAVLILRALEPKKPSGEAKCHFEGCGSKRNTLEPCPHCGYWFCPDHKNVKAPRFCSNCSPGIIDALRIEVTTDSKRTLRDHTVQLAGISLAGLAIIFSISPSRPSPTLVTSFSVAIFLFFLAYIPVGYFDSYASLFVEQVLYMAGIESLILGVVTFAYPTLRGFAVSSIPVGPAFIVTGVAAAFTVIFVTAMEIWDTASMLKGG